MALVDAVGLAQPVDVAVEQLHLACMPSAMAAAFMPGDTGADDHHLGRVDAGDAAHQHAAAAAVRIRWYAPTCGASRPATSLIGASSGSAPSGSWTVS